MKLRAAQSGMALLISLIMLLLLTIIAITAAQQSSMQARMAANSQQQNIAFQTAESGISAWIANYVAHPRIEALSVSDQLSDVTPFTAQASTPSLCTEDLDAFSLGGDSFQYACFNVQSDAKACANAACEDADNPARARHFQGHMVRY
jgi:type IV pilus assembly protein PilX